MSDPSGHVKGEMPKESDAELFARFMEAFAGLGKSPEAAGIDGISDRHLRRYVNMWERGERPDRLSSKTRSAMRAFLAGHVEGSNGGGIALAPAGQASAERIYVREIDRIAGLDVPEEVKIMARDSLAAALSRLEGVIAVRAGEARAWAIGAARGVTAPGLDEPLSADEVRWIVERRRQRDRGGPGDNGEAASGG